MSTCADTPDSVHVPQRTPEHLAQHAEARQRIESNDLNGAFELLEQLVAEQTGCWEVYNDLAALAVTQGDLEAACHFLEAGRTMPEAPAAIDLRLAQLLAANGDTDVALAALSPVLRADRSTPEALSLLREIVEAAERISAVAWARLIADLRAPTAEQKAKDARLTELTAEVNSLTAENRRQRAMIDSLRAELKLPRETFHDSRTSGAWSRIHALSDKDWLEALLQSVNVPSFKGFPMPGFPSTEVQVGMVGSSNEAALREGFSFYRAVRDVCTRSGQTWDGEGHLLDFGTGWGRYARIFMKDFRPENVVGIDVDPGFVKICRETFPYGTFETVAPLPPSSLVDRSFDLVIAYSVFSHLAEHAATAWVNEFARLLKPGGMMAITTQGRSFLDVCERMRKVGRFDHPWHRNLARSFVDHQACLAAYDAGQFLFSATGGGEVRSSDFYGEALIPKGYIEANWCDRFELVEFIDDRSYLPQALIVLRKRP